MEEATKPPAQRILRGYLYQVVDPSQEEIIHVVYPRVDTQRTYVLYYPPKKDAVLHLLHNLKQTISQVVSPNAVTNYFTKQSDDTLNEIFTKIHVNVTTIKMPTFTMHS